MSHGATSSALLARLAPELTGRVALIGAFDAASVPAVASARTETTWWADEQALAAELAAADARVVFDLLPEPAAADDVVLAVPRGRDAQVFGFARAAHAVRDGGRVWLVGATDEGVKSAAKRMSALGPVRKHDAARHGATFCVTGVEHVATGLDAWVRWHDLDVPGSPLRVASLPGVFAGGELDDGTRMLLETFDAPPVGPTLDVGCGAGVVGAWLARAGVERVTMVDAAAVAVESATRTIAHGGWTGATVGASDVYAGVTGEFACIVSNPPFHQGVHTDHDVASRLIAGAPDHLMAGGTLRIVANRFLRIPHRLDDTFGSHRVLAEDGRFRVYEATWHG